MLMPDVVSANASISACEKARQWQEALGFLEEMFHADTASYNPVISACEKHKL